MQYLLDTDWVAEYLRGTPRFVQALKERKADRLAISVITLAELFSGVARAHSIVGWRRRTRRQKCRRALTYPAHECPGTRHEVLVSREALKRLEEAFYGED